MIRTASVARPPITRLIPRSDGVEEDQTAASVTKLGADEEFGRGTRCPLQIPTIDEVLRRTERCRDPRQKRAHCDQGRLKSAA